MPEFEVPQFYETTITMRYAEEELDREFWFLCVPAAAIHEDNRFLLDDPPALLSVLDLTQTRELRGAQLPDGIFTLPRAEERGLAGAVVVVDGIGVVVGMVTSPKTVKAMGEARDGVKRLIHRSGGKPQPSPETPGHG